MTRIWESALTEIDKIVIKKGGYGQCRGLGKKPILIIIDAQHNYIGADVPIEDQLDKWPSGGGDIAWKGIRKIEQLKALADSQGIPVLYTRNVQKKTIQFDSFSTKAKRDQTKYLDGNPASEIVECLKPTDRDIVVDKSYASAFFGTPFISYLVKLKIDTLIIVGGSTSGCVRATAVDAVTYNFNVAIVEDAVFDRIELSHKAALLDLWMKYCDVVPSTYIESYMKSVAKELKEVK